MKSVAETLVCIYYFVQWIQRAKRPVLGLAAEALPLPMLVTSSCGIKLHLFIIYFPLAIKRYIANAKKKTRLRRTAIKSKKTIDDGLDSQLMVITCIYRPYPFNYIYYNIIIVITITDLISYYNIYVITFSEYVPTIYQNTVCHRYLLE